MTIPSSLGTEPAAGLAGSSCPNCEIRTLEILDTIARQCATTEILGALCRHTGRMQEAAPAVEDQAGLQIAFFLTAGENWTLAAQGDLAPHAEAALARIDPQGLSHALFQTAPATPGRLECPFHGGWARHLYSGTGELLGMLVGLADGPALPFGLHAIRIESICRLAALAIEQRNLLEELAFRTAQDSRTVLVQRSYDSEVSMQRIARMIAQQATPEEILGALCRHLGRAEAEFQIAFFLADGDNWRLVAKGDLGTEAEAALARIDPASLSEALLQREQSAAGRPECPLDTGWARHLFSGTGELLGIVVGLGDGPKVPLGIHATRIESICRLATLAIEQRNLLEELAFKADHDALTKLPNRGCYERVLAHTLRQKNGCGRSTALLYINLDRFRQVNDVMGIEIGNRLLAQVGRRFQSCLREGDLLARVGGDEFAILLPNRAAMEHAAAVAGRLLRSLSKPFSIDDHELFLSASIGIGYSTPASTPQSLEREAYVALYQAKQAGKAQSMSFRSSMAATPPERLEMEKRLRFALARREMRLYYQPQMELSSGRVRGAEALLRWRPEGLGLVSPAAFIPILEETGMIADFGRWVLAEACRQGKEWVDQAGFRLRIGVNVSALQFARADFVQDVEQALSDTGFPPELLELELTESLFVGDFAAAQRIFRNLQAAGIRFALDDFGVGQSSLSYLHELPFQRLKIDQAFIRRIEDGERQAPMVENILRMAESLGMSTIAEGVETGHQAELLRTLRCDEGQGYLFAPALPPTEFASFCRNHSPARVGLPEAGPLTAVGEFGLPMGD